MSPESAKSRAISVFFLICMLGMSVPFTVRHGLRLIRAAASLGWRETDAEILQTSLRTAGIPGRQKRRHEANIVFGYEVEGNRYESDHVSFDPVFLNTHARALDLVSRYPEGSRVQAYYNPRDFAEAVLQPGAHWSLYLFFSTGVFFTALSLVFGYLMLKSSGR